LKLNLNHSRPATTERVIRDGLRGGRIRHLLERNVRGFWDGISLPRASGLLAAAGLPLGVWELAWRPARKREQGSRTPRMMPLRTADEPTGQEDEHTADDHLKRSLQEGRVHVFVANITDHTEFDRDDHNGDSGG
jgi:hypothetical protein